MEVKDMIDGHKYLVGDGYGYDLVICIREPTFEELRKYMGEVPAGCSAKIVRFLDRENIEEIIFETPWYSGLYIEPRN